MNPTWNNDPNRPVIDAVDVTPAAPAAPAARRRRWIPATALVGGVLGAGLLLTTTAQAADDGGGTVPSSPTSSSSSATDGSATTPALPSDGSVPTPPTDGSVPTPPTDGSAPTLPAPPTDGSAPTPPTDGSAPTPPAGGPGQGPAAGGPAADGSTAVIGIVAASSDTGITVQSDDGESVTATFTDDTRFGPAGPGPLESAETDNAATTAADLTLGSRVEIRVLDGNITAATLVTAHADGTLTALSGSDATVTTREGLKIAVDLSGVTSTAVVGDHVHVRGPVDEAGTGITAESIEVPAAG